MEESADRAQAWANVLSAVYMPCGKPNGFLSAVARLVPLLPSFPRGSPASPNTQKEVVGAEMQEFFNAARSETIKFANGRITGLRIRQTLLSL